jgi:hypothetical protein
VIGCVISSFAKSLQGILGIMRGACEAYDKIINWRPPFACCSAVEEAQLTKNNVANPVLAIAQVEISRASAMMLYDTVVSMIL